MWSTNGAVQALFVALNKIFDQTERRSLLRLTLITLGFTACALLLSVFAIAVTVLGPYFLSFAGMPEGWLTTWQFLRWLILFVASASAVSILYRYAPNRERDRRPIVTFGGLGAAIVLTGGSAAFSWFVESFASLQITYGSLSTIVAFMIWLWMSFIIVLAGAEMDAAIERETEHECADGNENLSGRLASKGPAA